MSDITISQPQPVWVLFNRSGQNLVKVNLVPSMDIDTIRDVLPKQLLHRRINVYANAKENEDLILYFIPVADLRGIKAPYPVPEGLEPLDSVDILDDIIKDHDGKYFILIDVPSAQAESPTAPIAHTKQLITNAFPDGLPYIAPKPLLGTSGLHWDYQKHEDLEPKLQKAIRRHYRAVQGGYFDKTTIPIYLFLSGAGTGKSRNATEFHRTAVTCLGLDPKDEELRSKLSNAWVFHVSLENGTCLQAEEPISIRAIGNRMLLQLLAERSGYVTIGKIIENYEAPLPETVLELVAKSEKQELKDATVILVIDGMQNLMDSYEDGMSANTPFYRTLTAIGDLGHIGGFLLACCTATIVRPVNQTLQSSRRLRTVLPVASLNPPTIHRELVFNKNSTLLNILVGDCGGHGRALEILNDLIEAVVFQTVDVGELMRDLRDQLLELYHTALPTDLDEIRAIMRTIFLHQRISETQYIPNIKKFPDDVTAPGLVTYKPDEDTGYGYLHAPYVWLWVMAKRVGDKSPLWGWKLDDYSDIEAIEQPGAMLPTNCSWGNFELFVSRIRCMKSLLLKEGERTNVTQFHFGARLKGDIEFTNHHLHLAGATNKIQTATTNENSVRWVIDSKQEPRIDIRTHQYIVVNGYSASAGDSFLSLDAQSPANEIHQYKCLGETKIGQRQYECEREKAASNNDFFILFTTVPCDFELPHNSGIVDKQNWEDYFDPFAGRAFIHSVEGPLDINKADFATLQLVTGVGTPTATKIVNERKRRAFTSFEDAKKRTDIPEKTLKKFRYC